MVGTCNSSDVILVGDPRGVFNFTVSSSKVFFLCSFFFISCFSLYFFSCFLLSKTECRLLCRSFDIFVFQVVLIRLESGFKKKNLFSCNLGLIWFGYHDNFS